ncbi:MAG: hypothetical protein ABJB97_07340 [Acidobacteriota bacterium]
MKVDDDDDKARMTVDDLEIEDYGDLCNALADGPSVQATVSFDVRWKRPIATTAITNPTAEFTGLFTQTHATVEWSAREKRFEFHSDPANTSRALWAEVGDERNGIFF